MRVEHPCLELLRSSSDSQRLLGLYLAQKVLSEEKKNVLTVEEVVEAVGIPFLTRLIADREYTELAVDILTCVAKLKPELYSRIKVDDVLLQSGLNGAIELVAAAGSCGLKVVEAIRSKPDEFAFSILLLTVTHSGELVAKASLHEVSKRISLKSCTLESKLKALPLVLEALSNLESEVCVSAWTLVLRTWICEILRSRVDKDTRFLALEVVRLGLRWFGREWVSSVVSSSGMECDFIKLIVGLVSIEIQVGLDAQLRCLSDNNKLAMCSSMEIVELVLQGLVCDFDEDCEDWCWHRYGYETIEFLQKKLHEILGALGDFMLDFEGRAVDWDLWGRIMMLWCTWIDVDPEDMKETIAAGLPVLLGLPWDESPDKGQLALLLHDLVITYDLQ